MKSFLIYTQIYGCKKAGWNAGEMRRKSDFPGKDRSNEHSAEEGGHGNRCIVHAAEKRFLWI